MVGVLGDDNPEGFKYMREGDIRYDRVLLAMVDEVAQKLETRFDRFMMFGFSGGGHFVHRFFYLHPGRLLAASIGSPGAVTLYASRMNAANNSAHRFPGHSVALTGLLTAVAAVASSG